MPELLNLIKLDLQSFRQRQTNGTVTGVIFIELDGEAIPDAGWSDFPVIVLGWWVDAFLQLSEPKRRQVRWLFMDGPFELMLTKVPTIGPSSGVKCGEIATWLLTAADQVINFCEAEKMLSRDLDDLRLSVQHLKSQSSITAARVEHSSRIEFQLSQRRSR